MPTASEISVRITAQNEAARVLQQLQRQMQQTASEQSQSMQTVTRRTQQSATTVGRLQQAWHELSRANALTGTVRATRDISHYTMSIGEGLARAVPQAAALTGALGAGVGGLAGALGDLLKNSAEWGNHLKQTSIMTGVSAERLQQFGYAAAVAGGSSDAAIQGISGLAKNMNLLMHTGRGDPTISAGLQLLGVSAQDAHGHLKNTGDLYDEVMRKLAAEPNAQKRAYEGNMVLGDSYSGVAYELNNGVKRYEAYQQRAGQMVKATNGQVNNLAALQGSLNQLTGDVTGLGRAVAGDLAPEVKQMVDNMAKWIEKNQAWLESDIAADVKAFGADVVKLAEDANNVAKALGGWVDVAKILGGLFVTSKVLPIVADTASIIASIARITQAFVVMRAAATAAQTAETAATVTGGVEGVVGGGLGLLSAPVVAGAAVAGVVGYGLEKINENSPVAQATTKSHADFVRNYMPVAQKIAAATGEDPRLVLAQMALETGWGQHVPGNNFSGIKGPGQNLTTKEFFPGVGMVNTQGSFASYPSVDAWADAYIRLMNGNQRYAGVHGGSLDSQTAALAGSGYATDPNYGTKLSGVEGQINSILATPPAAPPMAPVPTGTAGSASAAGGDKLQGNLKVDITHRGAPPGTTISARSSGNVVSGPPTVTSMPDMGGIPAGAGGY